MDMSTRGRPRPPGTASLKGGALDKVPQSLLAKGFIEETAAEAGTNVWRDEDEGPVTLRATHAAVALGVEPEPETPGLAPGPAPVKDATDAAPSRSPPGARRCPGRGRGR